MDVKHKGLLLVLFTAVISGFSIFLNAFGVKGIDSSVFTFAKNLVVALFLFTIIFGFHKFRELALLSKKQWLQLAGVGLIGGSIPFLLFFKGLQMTTGTTSAFIHKTLFIYATIFALIFLKEKLHKGVIVGAMLLLLGNFIMLKPDFAISIGHVLILGATLFWALENVISKQVLKNTSGTVVAFGRMFFGSLFILGFLLFTDKVALLTSMSSAQYIWIGITSVFLFGYVVTFYNGLKHVKISTATAILALGSPITTILGWMFLGNAFVWENALGIGFIVLGIGSMLWLANLFKSKLVATQDERN